MPRKILSLQPEWHVLSGESEARAAAEKAGAAYDEASCLLAPMTLGERETWQNLMSRPGQAGTAVIYAVRCGLRGWKGILALDGSPAKFERDADGRVLDATLELLNWPSICELAKVVQDRSFLGDDARKNYGSPST